MTPSAREILPIVWLPPLAWASRGSSCCPQGARHHVPLPERCGEPGFAAKGECEPGATLGSPSGFLPGWRFLQGAEAGGAGEVGEAEASGLRPRRQWEGVEETDSPACGAGAGRWEGDPGPGPAPGSDTEPLPGGCVALGDMPLLSSKWGLAWKSGAALRPPPAGSWGPEPGRCSEGAAPSKLPTSFGASRPGWRGGRAPCTTRRLSRGSWLGRSWWPEDSQKQQPRSVGSSNSEAGGEGALPRGSGPRGGSQL